jgi:hypothetical protein
MHVARAAPVSVMVLVWQPALIILGVTGVVLDGANSVRVDMLRRRHRCQDKSQANQHSNELSQPGEVQFRFHAGCAYRDSAAKRKISISARAARYRPRASPMAMGTNSSPISTCPVRSRPRLETLP